MGPIVCSETSVNKQKSRPRNTPEERRSHSHLGGNLKSRKINLQSTGSAWTRDWFSDSVKISNFLTNWETSASSGNTQHHSVILCVADIKFKTLTLDIRLAVHWHSVYDSVNTIINAKLKLPFSQSVKISTLAELSFYNIGVNWSIKYEVHFQASILFSFSHYALSPAV